MPFADHADILQGLLAEQASLPPKLFYDRLGSTLFTAICELPEYYPTRTEAAIFQAHGAAIGAGLPAGLRMIDLGAGDCRKAASLFADLAPASYVGVDISGDFVSRAVQSLQREHPAIEMSALVRDFTQPWSLPAAMLADPLLFFYPGSSLGNFDRVQARDFLRTLAGMGTTGVEPPSLLIGIDLVKPTPVLEAAYDDELGVTAAFNRNMLTHANRLVGTDFVLADWSHRALFNVDLSRIEMHLVARRPLTVSWPGGSRAFAPGETIHTENSYKYTRDGFDDLLRDAGFKPRGHWQDDDRRFLVVLAQARRD
ncbi:MAG: L-histidine N(alpha)-methyltransferase [Burkholderiaceae bacterium]